MGVGSGAGDAILTSSSAYQYSPAWQLNITQFMEQGLNAALYYENTKTQDLLERVSIIPTSGISGEGIPDMLLLIVQLTQTMMAEALMFSSTLQCTILEVKVIEGLGTTIDCILVSGQYACTGAQRPPVCRRGVQTWRAACSASRATFHHDLELYVSK